MINNLLIIHNKDTNLLKVMRVKYNHAKLVRETCDIKKKIYYSQVLRVMYELPKDIKIKIFQMAIKNHQIPLKVISVSLQ